MPYPFNIKQANDYNLRKQISDSLNEMFVALSGASGFNYRGDINSQAANDPGAGHLRWNNITQIASTRLYVDWLTVEGFDAHLLFLSMGPPGKIIIQETGLAVRNQVWTMNAPAIQHPDWFEVPVTFDSASASPQFTHNQKISVLLVDTPP